MLLRAFFAFLAVAEVSDGPEIHRIVKVQFRRPSGRVASILNIAGVAVGQIG